MSDVRTIVREFILSECRPGAPASDLSDDERVLENGTVDSMALVKLTTLLEQHTGIEIEAHEVTEENFGSVDDVVAFVASRTGA